MFLRHALYSLILELGLIATGAQATWHHNSAVQWMQSVALAGNKSDCWYCAHAPQLSSTGIPWAAVPWNESWALNDTTFLTKYNETPPYWRQGTPVVVLGNATGQFNVTASLPGLYSEWMAGETWVSNDNCSGSSGTNLTYSNGTTLCHRWWHWGEWGLHTCGFLYYFNTSTPVWKTPLNTIRHGHIPRTHYWPQCNQSSDSWCRNTSGSIWLSTAGLPGLYWLCGRWAYKTLPNQWYGRCTLGRLLPYSYGMHTMHARAVHNYILVTRSRRSTNPIVQRPTGFYQFIRAFLPWLGVAELERAIVNISATLEIIENDTIDAIHALQLEVTSLSQVVLQNRMALDYLLAAQGGVCALINESCCFYSNQDKRIETDVHNMMDHLKVLHNVAWSVSSSFSKALLFTLRH
uniref:Envelope protein n=1 Tax=Terrapene triunguis TaxID=2587831 RepID=A0A674J828_9SAUR